MIALKFPCLRYLRNELPRCERHPGNPIEPWAASRTSADGGRQRRKFTWQRSSGSSLKSLVRFLRRGTDGTRRALVEGDRLFAGDQVITGAEGAVAVHLQNGHELTLGRDSSMTMTGQLLANQAPHVDSPEALTPTEAQLTDVEQIQKAIAAGEDPSKAAEATAAGPNAPTGVPGELGGGHRFCVAD